MVGKTKAKPALYYASTLVMAYLMTVGIIIQYFMYHNLPGIGVMVFLLICSTPAAYSILKKQSLAVKIKARKVLLWLTICSIFIGTVTDNILIPLLFSFSGMWPVDIFYSDDKEGLAKR